MGDVIDKKLRDCHSGCLGHMNEEKVFVKQHRTYLLWRIQAGYLGQSVVTGITRSFAGASLTTPCCSANGRSKLAQPTSRRSCTCSHATPVHLAATRSRMSGHSRRVPLRAKNAP